MFDFGFWELVVVAVVALLVVGPKRLPELARQAGAWVGHAKRFVNSVRTDIERELQSEELKSLLNDQQAEIRQLKGILSKTQAEVKAEMWETEKLAKTIEQQLGASAEQKRPEDGRSAPESGAASLPNDATAKDDAKRFTGG